MTKIYILACLNLTSREVYNPENGLIASRN